MTSYRFIRTGLGRQRHILGPLDSVCLSIYNSILWIVYEIELRFRTRILTISDKLEVDRTTQISSSFQDQSIEDNRNISLAIVSSSAELCLLRQLHDSAIISKLLEIFKSQYVCENNANYKFSPDFGSILQWSLFLLHPSQHYIPSIFNLWKT